MTAFVDAEKARFGVEPICRVLTQHGCMIAPSTYYAARNRAPSKRQLRDAELSEKIRAVHVDRARGRGLAGARKVWHHLKRDGVVVARCTVERLMRANGLVGASRGRRHPVTTLTDPAATRPPDLVQRRFTADGAEPAVDRGLHLRADLVRDGLRGVRHRRVLAAHRRLAHGRPDAHRTTAGRARDGPVDPGNRRSTPRRTDPPLRSPATRADSTGRRNTSPDHRGVRWHDVSSRRIGLCDRRCARRAGRCRRGMWSAPSGG